MTEQRTTIWVCLACGKRSADRYGEHAVNRGWDESCMLNAALCYVDALTMDGELVSAVSDGGFAPEPPSA